MIRAAIVVATVLITCPAMARETVYFAPRAGMTLTVQSKTGLNSSHAIIRVKLTQADIIDLCRVQDPRNPKCAQEAPKWISQVVKRDRVTANCKTGEYVDLRGDTVVIKNNHVTRDNVLLQDSSAVTDMINTYKMLCPALAR